MSKLFFLMQTFWQLMKQKPRELLPYCPYIGGLILTVACGVSRVVGSNPASYSLH